MKKCKCEGFTMIDGIMPVCFKCGEPKKTPLSSLETQLATENARLKGLLVEVCETLTGTWESVNKVSESDADRAYKILKELGD